MHFPITGVYPPMLTPFKEDGELDIAGHLSNMDRWNKTALSGYLVLGSNSEAAYLTEKEKLFLIEKTAEVVPGDRILLAGTGMESTLETISLTQKAAERGAQAALILTPFYYLNNMTDEALLQHFLKIADAVEIPILIYNVPKFTHLNVSNHLLSALGEHQNIIGMKDSSGNIGQMVSYQSFLSEHFNLLVGTAALWYPALIMGIKGGIMALANIFPDECVQIQTLVNQGNGQEAEQKYRGLYPVNHAITVTYGVAGLKYAADFLGYKGGHVRSPLLPLNLSQKKAIEEIILNTQLI